MLVFKHIEHFYDMKTWLFYAFNLFISETIRRRTIDGISFTNVSSFTVSQKWILNRIMVNFMVALPGRDNSRPSKNKTYYYFCNSFSRHHILIHIFEIIVSFIDSKDESSLLERTSISTTNYTICHLKIFLFIK